MGHSLANLCSFEISPWKEQIEKSASRVRGYKVSLSNTFRNHQSYHIYKLNFDLKCPQYILDIIRTTILQKSQKKKKKK